MLAKNTIYNQLQTRDQSGIRKAVSDYQVFMLRIWQEYPSQPEAAENIRLSIEDTRTGKRVGFADWDRLMIYLQEQVNNRAPE